jgi:hypothetical protein
MGKRRLGLDIEPALLEAEVALVIRAASSHAAVEVLRVGEAEAWSGPLADRLRDQQRRG